ncbi:MAG: hypothetical protein PHD03_00985 [Bacilli bacterium]|nr:hypothetical protein [Bacilli bacterium]MDD4406578.1 hypothetical protein [Bacilli bacterium]
MKKLYIFITIIITSFLCFLFILYTPKNYTINYKIKEYNIKESYVNDKELYKIIINYNNKIFPFLVDVDYNNNRKIIKNIYVKKNKNNICLLININNKKYQACYKKDTLVDYRLLSLKNNNEEIIDEYNSIKIYNYNNLEFYIWNYKGYYFISKDKKQSIKILEKDEYDNLLSYQFENYLITPNYDENYYFLELLIINNKDSEINCFKLNNEISYSSLFLGDFKNDIYLLDKKNILEYKINIKKNTVKIIGSKDKDGLIYNNGKNKNVALKKIINNKLKFTKKVKYNYKIIKNKLYFAVDNYNILISNNDIKEIVKINDDKIYYLSENSLYVYSPNNGEIKLLENKEWNFNYKNKIFIFN